jgi:hypothetical protein
MSKRHLLVSALVAALCTGILVLFTEIEDSFQLWIRCAPLQATSPSPECRR